MTILVTGASGNVGRYVVNALLEKGLSVVAAGTKPEKLEDLFEDKVRAVYFDFTIPASFERALEGVSGVFLMRPPHLGKPQDLYPFIDAMKTKNIQLVTFLSLMGVENNTIPPHHKIEKYIEEVGLPFAHIRPGFFMQNLSGVHAEEIKKLNKIFVPAGASKTSFIDARDIGLAAATLLEAPEKYQNTAHTLTGPEALDYHQVAQILSEELGRRIEYARPGFLRYRHYYIHTRGLDKTYVNVTVALYFMTRMGTAKEVTRELYALTGKEPTSFRSFVRREKEAFS